jgi:phosphatidylserine decarboxylase
VAYPEGTVTVNQDIQRQSALGIETQVEIGEGVGWKND